MCPWACTHLRARVIHFALWPAACGSSMLPVSAIISGFPCRLAHR